MGGFWVEAHLRRVSVPGGQGSCPGLTQLAIPPSSLTLHFHSSPTRSISYKTERTSKRLVNFKMQSVVCWSMITNQFSRGKKKCMYQRCYSQHKSYRHHKLLNSLLVINIFFVTFLSPDNQPNNKSSSNL